MGAVIDADRLRTELAIRGWTQGQLAVAAGLTEPTITKALRGRQVDVSTISAVARALTLAR